MVGSVTSIIIYIEVESIADIEESTYLIEQLPRIQNVYAQSSYPWR